MKKVAKILLAILLLLQFASVRSQNVSINETGNPPDASAMLDVVSIGKGMLIPRVALLATNNTSPVSSPAVSLLVYNTATSGSAPNNVVPGFYYWDGAAWIPFLTRKGGWELTGNDITSAPSSWLGTISNHDLVIKTFNTEKMRIMAGGNVGIGTNNPGVKLDVIGNIRAGFATSNTLMGTHSTYGNTYAAWWKDGFDYSLLTEGTNTFLNAPTASGNLYFRTANTDKAILLGSSGNFGIAKTAPTEKLDVEGAIRFSKELKPNNNAGNSGQILVSQGTGLPPVWSTVGSVIQAFGVNATKTLVSSSYPTMTAVTGLSRSVTVTGNALLFITTWGGIETKSTAEDGGSGTIIQIFQNGSGLSNGMQTVDVSNTYGYVQLVSGWSISTFVNVTAGTYIFDVRAAKYIGSNFNAGGSDTSPQQNEGSLTILVIPQ
jgi:hypothetical protein